MLKIAGLVLCEIISYVILKQYKPEYAVFSQLAFCVLLVFFVKNELSDVTAAFSAIFEQSGVAVTYMTSLLKILGIALITQFAADMCRDAGQSAAANKTEFAGKILIIAAALPIIKSITDLLTEMVNEG